MYLVLLQLVTWAWNAIVREPCYGQTVNRNMGGDTIGSCGCTRFSGHFGLCRCGCGQWHSDGCGFISPLNHHEGKRHVHLGAV